MSNETAEDQVATKKEGEPVDDPQRQFRLRDGAVLHIADDWASPMVEVRLAEWRAEEGNEKPIHPDIEVELESATGMKKAWQPAPKASDEYKQYEQALLAWQNEEFTQQFHLKFHLAIGLTDEQRADIADSRAFGHNHSEHDGAFFVFDHIALRAGETLFKNQELNDVLNWIDAAPWGLKWGEGASLATFRQMFRRQGEASANADVRAAGEGSKASKRSKRPKATTAA